MSEGVEVIMLTGDNENTAKKAVADAIGLTSFKSCLPEDKLKKIKITSRR
jgi:Cu2+-exporting ATPase